jgi:hypothetical protein
MSKLTTLVCFCPDHGHSLLDDAQFEHDDEDEHEHCSDE